MKSRKTVLITDLDNTLFDWFDMWYASNSVMYAKVSEISGVGLETLLPEVKAVHQKHGTAEYAFVLESLPSLQKKYGDRHSINEALDDAIHAFRSSRKRHLKLYPSVQATLATLKDKGVLLVAYTESKSYYTSYRLKKLVFDFMLDSIALK
ncbi:HAD family hydrolase [Vibrio sp. 10N.222.55.A1]|uniref:HAD family hydrolase n=1 Tax=Vibrio sp. 10N.222.55.A1 TaxID=3229646 RepID=UPI00354F8C0F